MNCLFWNTRGSGYNSFTGLVRELSSRHKVEMVAILETRSSGARARKLATRLGFQHMEIVDSRGFSGGLWVLWKEGKGNYEILETNHQFIHLRLSFNSLVVYITAVYASPNPITRRLLWSALKRISETVDSAWCLGGDFNSTLYERDRRLALHEHNRVDRDFNNWMEDLNFSDLTCRGPYFTWKRGNSESRIDRVVVNNAFSSIFPDVELLHLPYYRSDHRPLLLKMTNEEPCQLNQVRPFRFIASWILHDDFDTFIKNLWRNERSWLENVACFTEEVQQWKLEVYGHLGKQKRHLFNRLDGLSRMPDHCRNKPELDKLQKRIWQELEDILIQEELLWAQKAKCEWFSMGDKNTKYFHAKANGRRKRKRIEAIKKDNGDWTYDVSEIKTLALNFFHSLFMEEGGTGRLEDCSVTYPTIKESDLQMLGAHLSDEEIKGAIGSMGALKSPGPDGLNALFFQSQWSHVGESVCSFLKEVCEDHDKVKSMNGTLLVLIPKVDHPESIKDFRPISLCNVIYKILTKVLTFRIKNFLPDIISPNQCSFVPGRISSDNIIIAQEVIHSMKNMKGKKGFMAIKVDLEKAYDRLRWDFVLSCLEELNFPHHIVSLIKACITSVNMQILWEGSATREFLPSRGIRQGDPLSPYLFVICMEKLAHIIQEEVSRGDWKPIRLCKDGPPLSHLFFADDLILLSEASMDQVEVIQRCMNRFCHASGQKVSNAKTRIFFSQNVNHTRVQQLSELLGFTPTADLGKYLGVPLHHQRVTKDTYQYVIDKVKVRLSNWKANHLALAGRHTLVSSVINAIPVYPMQTAILPATICEEVESRARSFLWGSTAEKKKTHLVAWDVVCKEKRKGGLGLRHMKMQNQALCLKGGWGLIKKKDELWAKVIRSKYKCGVDLMPQINKSRPGSRFWNGIKNNWNLLDKGIEKITLEDGRDEVRWKLEPHGCYSVKSAYKLIHNDNSPPSSIWNKVWKLKVPQRCKTCLWAILHNRLLTNALRVQRGMAEDATCVVCGESMEHLLHVLRDCPRTKSFWKSIIHGKYRVKFFNTDLWEWCALNLSKPVGSVEDTKWAEFFAMSCWLLWKFRNEKIFEGLNADLSSLKIRVAAITDSIRRNNKRCHNVNLQGSHEMPEAHSATIPSGYYKLSVDGAFSELLCSAACGGGIWDPQGNFYGGFMMRIQQEGSLSAELWGCLTGLKQAWDMGIRKVVLLTDCLDAWRLCREGCTELHMQRSLVLEIRSLVERSWQVEIRHIPRNLNLVADNLAKRALNMELGFYLVDRLDTDLVHVEPG